MTLALRFSEKILHSLLHAKIHYAEKFVKKSLRGTLSKGEVLVAGVAFTAP
jgi:hypothetical protein